MGQGIYAGIPIKFYFDSESSKEKYIKEFTDGIFEFYNKTDEDGLDYEIKFDKFFLNFEDLYLEMNDLFKEKPEIPENFFSEEYEKIAKDNNFEAFLNYLENIEDNVPIFCENVNLYLSGMNTQKVLFIYSGSYKADLEEYTTLYHMEHLFVKAASNPLKVAFKIGIFG